MIKFYSDKNEYFDS